MVDYDPTFELDRNDPDPDEDTSIPFLGELTAAPDDDIPDEIRAGALRRKRNGLQAEVDRASCQPSSKANCEYVMRLQKDIVWIDMMLARVAEADEAHQRDEAILLDYSASASVDGLFK